MPFGRISSLNAAESLGAIVIYRTLAVASLLVGCALGAQTALAQTPGTYPFVGKMTGADCSATSSAGLATRTQSTCNSSASGATAQAQVTDYDQKAKVAVQDGGQSVVDGSFGGYAAHTHITENVFIKPFDMQYAGTSGTVSFLFDLDGSMSGDQGNVVLFGMNQIQPCDAPLRCWNTTFGSGKWLADITDENGNTVTNVSGVFESRVTIGAAPVDIYVNGTAIFTFPVQFNSYTTFERYLSVYAGSAGSFVDFFNTASLTSVQAFDANGARIAIDLVNTNTGVNYAQAMSAVPEPGTWAMMLVGFGAIGTSMRRRHRRTKVLAQMA
jgi:hypothetical protein